MCALCVCFCAKKSCSFIAFLLVVVWFRLQFSSENSMHLSLRFDCETHIYKWSSSSLLLQMRDKLTLPKLFKLFGLSFLSVCAAKTQTHCWYVRYFLLPVLNINYWMQFCRAYSSQWYIVHLSIHATWQQTTITTHSILSSETAMCTTNDIQAKTFSVLNM